MLELLLAQAVLAARGRSLLADTLDGKIADAIYRIEGGSKARVPYGILSVPVKDEADARRICLNTIRNNRERWRKAGQPGDYLDFLADRYCPPSVDKQGNLNWKKNIRKILKTE
jgi:hypothetical protein